MDSTHSFIDKETQELVRGLTIDNKLRAKSPQKGKPIIFYLKDSNGKLALSKLGKTDYVTEWVSSNHLSEIAARRVIERYSQGLVRKGYALPVALKYLALFLSSGFSSYSSFGDLSQYGAKKLADLVNYSMRIYHDEISLKTNQAGYRYLPATELIEGKYLSYTVFNTDVKVTFLMGGLGLGKSYASIVFIGKFLSEYNKIVPYPRTSLVNEKTIFNNEILLKECPENYTSKPLDKLKEGDKRISIADKQAFNSLYELKNNRNLCDDVANNSQSTKDVVTTVDSLDIVIDGHNVSVKLLYIDENNELQINPIGGKKRKLVLVLDEIESTSQHFLAATLRSASEKFDTLRRLIELADKVIVMDAFLSQNTIDWITSLLSVPSYEIIECENPHMRDINVTFYSGNAKQGAGLEALNKDCEARGKISKNTRKGVNNAIGVYANTASEAMVIGEYLNGQYCHNSALDSQDALNICVYTKNTLRVYSRMGKNHHTNDYKLSDFQDNPNQFINDKRIDIMIFSPVMESGVSLDKTPQFTKMYAFAKPSFKNSNAFGLQQSLYRFRNTIDWHIVISPFSDSDSEVGKNIESLDNYVDSILDSLAVNAKICLSQESSNKHKKQSQKIIEDTMHDSFVLDKLEDIASKYYDFGAAWRDLVKIRGIQTIAVTKFANMIYLNLQRMGIVNFKVCIDDHDIDTSDIRRGIREQYYLDLANTENPTSDEEIKDLKMKQDRENLTKEESLILLRGLLLTDYSENGSYNHGHQVRDMRSDSPTFGGIIDMNLLGISDQKSLFEAYVKNKDKLHNAVNLNRIDEIVTSMKVSICGIGDDEKWKTNDSKLDRVSSKNAQAILASQAVEQLISDNGLSKEWAIEHGVPSLLNCSDSQAVNKLLRMLNNNYGVGNDVVSSQQKQINGKRVRYYKADSSKLKSNPLYIQSTVLVGNEKDVLSQRLENIADYVVKREL